jgi:hypothetical protein
MLRSFLVYRPQGVCIKISITIPKDKPQERVEKYRNCNILIAKFLCCIIVHLLVYSLYFNKTVCGFTCCVL